MMNMKPEWKKFMQEKTEFAPGRINYCIRYNGTQEVSFWAGSYICYGKSKQGMIRNGKVVSRLNHMSLLSPLPSLIHHLKEMGESRIKYAQSMMRKIKKSDTWKFVYEILSCRPLKIKDNLYSFKVDIEQPQWKVQLALFINRGILSMNLEQMKWANKLKNIDDMVRYALIVPTFDRYERAIINRDSNMLGYKFNIELAKRILNGERLTGDRWIDFDKPFSENGQWIFSQYIDAMGNRGNNNRNYYRISNIVIGNKTIKVQEW